MKFPTKLFLFTHSKGITTNMKIIIDIEDSKAEAFINFIKLIDFIEIISTEEKDVKEKDKYP